MRNEGTHEPFEIPHWQASKSEVCYFPCIRQPGDRLGSVQIVVSHTGVGGNAIVEHMYVSISVPHKMSNPSSSPLYLRSWALILAVAKNILPEDPNMKVGKKLWQSTLSLILWVIRWVLSDWRGLVLE
jgi:hypothetical protein